MINVSDTCVVGKKNSYDFEEYTTTGSVSMEIDSWSTDNNSFSASHTAVTVKDDSIINIFSQSIELFGNSMAPWPSAKTIPEQVAGIFLTSESPSPKDEPAQSRLEANRPQIQSKLRRSTSTSRRISITRINEEISIESQQIYKELEPIPIVASEKAGKQGKRSPSAVSAKDAENILEAQKERTTKSSRLHNWLASLYSRGTSHTRQTTPKDEESGLSISYSDNNSKATKGILKKTSPVQKSASITETEAQSITTAPAAQKPKKTMKLRFDNEVAICETFHKDDYSRQSLDYVARQLTPSLALQIKKELNSVKQEMEVHEDARHLTQFYLIK